MFSSYAIFLLIITDYPILLFQTLIIRKVMPEKQGKKTYRCGPCFRCYRPKEEITTRRTEEP